MRMAGTSAGSLIGLQFVVLTLIANRNQRPDPSSIQAFGSPIVVHFCSTLLVSAMMLAPWRSITHLSGCLGVMGCLGLLYSLRTIRHAIKADYDPDVEDWIWFIVLPLISYGVLASAGVLVFRSADVAALLTAAASLALLFIGIHNAWDTVTYITTRPTPHKDLTRGE